MANDSGVFILTLYEDAAHSSTEIFSFSTLDELNDYLAAESYGDTDSGGYKVYHGVTTEAKFIPNSLNGCTPFIIIRNPTGKTNKVYADQVHFEKVSGGVENLTRRIEILLKEQKYDFYSNNKPSINDVRLFFGHELKMILKVSEDSLDEELIERVSGLSETITEHNKKVKDGLYETNS